MGKTPDQKGMLHTHPVRDSIPTRLMFWLFKKCRLADDNQNYSPL